MGICCVQGFFKVCCVILLAGCAVFAPCTMRAQDFGEESSADSAEAKEGKHLEAPYRMALKVRPLAYLLYPLSGGAVGSFNFEAEEVVSRWFVMSVGVNYLYADFNAATGPDSLRDFSQTSLRLDPKFYLSALLNPDHFASGFFIGPYYKYRYARGSFSGSLLISVVHSHLFGILAGYQYRKNRFLFSPAAGLGAGFSQGYNFTVPAFDLRLGLSLGMVLF